MEHSSERFAGSLDGYFDRLIFGVRGSDHWMSRALATEEVRPLVLDRIARGEYERAPLIGFDRGGGDVERLLQYMFTTKGWVVEMTISTHEAPLATSMVEHAQKLLADFEHN